MSSFGPLSTHGWWTTWRRCPTASRRCLAPSCASAAEGRCNTHVATNASCCLGHKILQRSSSRPDTAFRRLCYALHAAQAMPVCLSCYELLLLRWLTQSWSPSVGACLRTAHHAYFALDLLIYVRS